MIAIQTHLTQACSQIWQLGAKRHFRSCAGGCGGLSWWLQIYTHLEVGNRTCWTLYQVVRERPDVDIIGFNRCIPDHAQANTGGRARLRELLQYEVDPIHWTA